MPKRKIANTRKKSTSTKRASNPDTTRTKRAATRHSNKQKVAQGRLQAEAARKRAKKKK